MAVLLYPTYTGAHQLGINVPHHFTRITEVLLGFQVIFRLTGSVTATEARTVLEDAVAMKPRVLMFVYCGHGRDNPKMGERVRSQHGTLCLSNGVLSEDDIVAALGGFSGTLIRFLNMCSAGPLQPQASNAALQSDPDLGWGTQGQVHNAPCAFKTVNFFSSINSKKVCPLDADKMLEAFVNAAGKDYATLRESWPGWEMAESYSGKFPGVAV